MTKRIGLLGGTFDPPHIGHLIIAEEVRFQLQLDEIWFLPTNEPPHKGVARSNNEHRKQMLSLAIKNNPYFHINTVEYERSGKSYTIDTMHILTERHPNVTFYFIIGADMVEYLPHWKNIDELLDIVQFVGVERRGFTIETTYPIQNVSIPLIDISSSEIKERIEKNRPIQYFVPDEVLQYIKEYRLYGYRTSTRFNRTSFNERKI